MTILLKRGLDAVQHWSPLDLPHDPATRKALRLLALKSGGAYFKFNPNAPRAVERPSDHLNAIARLGVGDREALRIIKQ
jgi:hypothetical protein